MNFGQPATQLLLHGDDRRHRLLSRCADALQESPPSLRRNPQGGHVVCIKNQQFLFRTFAAFDTRARVVRHLALSRRPPACQGCSANPFFAAANPAPVRLIQRAFSRALPHVVQASATCHQHSAWVADLNDEFRQAGADGGPIHERGGDPDSESGLLGGPWEEEPGTKPSPPSGRDSCGRCALAEAKLST